MQTFTLDLLVGQVLGAYRVERLLVQGRLQTIFLARHLVEQRIDALTLYTLPEHFSPSARTRFLARFRGMATAITTLAHPHILPIYAYGEVGGSPYLITPYMMNGSLADLLKQQGPYTYDDVAFVLEQIVAGLAYAHNKGFIHGTLKPANILVRDEGVFQVAGFGLMHLLQLSGIEQTDRPMAHLLSVGGTLLATPEYCAPEVLQGRSVDARSDVYALGCILFEMLSGTSPLAGIDPMQLANAQRMPSLPSLRALSPTLPAVLVAIINQALERNPAHRFQHVSELGEAFAQAAHGIQSQHSVTPARDMYMADAGLSHLTAGTTWQLKPPIVANKLANTIERGREVVPTRAAPTLITAGGWSLPSTPLRAEQRAARTLVPDVDERTIQAVLQSSTTDTQDEAELLAQQYQWWSQPNLLAATKQEADAPLILSGPSTTRSLSPSAPVPADWTVERDERAASLQSTPAEARRRPRPMKRRRVLALLAGGTAVAAGAAVLFNLRTLIGTPAGQPSTQPAAQQTRSGNTTAPNMTINNTRQGNVIGASTQASNTAMDFINPADNKRSLLIHLPNGTFAAYERACTHEGILVNYDAATHTLVCPAHGAIFDPADAGKVLQGPATIPLPKITVQVNADGTITSA